MIAADELARRALGISSWSGELENLLVVGRLTVILKVLKHVQTLENWENLQTEENLQTGVIQNGVKRLSRSRKFVRLFVLLVLSSIGRKENFE